MFPRPAGGREGRVGTCGPEGVPSAGHRASDSLRSFGNAGSFQRGGEGRLEAMARGLAGGRAAGHQQKSGKKERRE